MVNSRSRIYSNESDENSLGMINNDSFLKKDNYSTNLDSKKCLFGRCRKSSTPSFKELHANRLELEHTCLHCQLGIVHRRNLLEAKLKMAVKLHSRRLELNRPLRSTPALGSWPRVDEHSPSITNSEINITNTNYVSLDESQHQRSMGTPDIVVSSISSDDEYTESGLVLEANTEINQSFEMSTSICPTPLKLLTWNFKENRPITLFSPKKKISLNRLEIFSNLVLKEKN